LNFPVVQQKRIRSDQGVANHLGQVLTAGLRRGLIPSCSPHKPS